MVYAANGKENLYMVPKIYNCTFVSTNTKIYATNQVHQT